MSYSYQFRLKIIKLVIYWLKAFRERGLDGVKSPYTLLPPRK